MGRQNTYTDAEMAELVALHDEIVLWGETRRRERWSTARISAGHVHEVALERGLRVASTDRPWTYTTVLRALQRAGKLEVAPRPGRPAHEPRSGTSSGGVRSPAAKSPDSVFAFFEKDLGSFLRPEDRASSQRAAAAATARKIQELTSELAEKTETRARLEMYLGVYDRLIGRLTHRIDVLRDRDVDPEDEERADRAARVEEDAEAVAAHGVAGIGKARTGGGRRR